MHHRPGLEPTTDRRKTLHSLWNHIRMGASESDVDEEDRDNMRALFASRFALANSESAAQRSEY